MLKHHLDNGVCTFCNEFRDIEDCNFRRVFAREELDSRVIYQTKNFVSIPGLGPLGDAYLLILPREHYPCLAALPQKLYAEFNNIKTKMIGLLTKIYQAPIVFEHGTANLKKLSAGCCVEHAHIHIVCTSIDLLNELKAVAALGKFSSNSQLHPRQIDSLMELRKWIELSFGYIFYETQTGEKWGFPVNKPIESQFIRRRLAQRLYVDDITWDWLLFPGKEKVISTWKELKQII